MGENQAFCAECGTALHGAKFCPHCGVMTENARETASADVQQAATSGNDGGADGRATTVRAATESEAARMTVPPPGVRAPASPPAPPVGRPYAATGGLPPPTPSGQKQAAPAGRLPLFIGIAAGAALAAVIAVVLILLLSGGGGDSYVSQARAAITPVIQNNNQLKVALNSLSSSGSAPATAAVQTTIGAVKGAQSRLGTLKPGAGDRQFDSNARVAMASELAWLNAAASVLRNPGSPMLSQLGALGIDAQTKLQAIDPQVPGASASFPGSTKLIAWAQEQSRKGALTQFSEQVQSLLNQSAPAYQEINRLFREMQTAASGGEPTITLVQAESIINGVVANRTSLAASARTLNAPNSQAASVRDALVAAYDASLKNDQDINNCLTQANTGTVATIFQDCLNATASSSEAATDAKQHFLAVYNQLRQDIGQPATNQQF